MTDNAMWQVPPWVSSRNYNTGAAEARSILTNARNWTNFLLTGLSSDLWASLPNQFSIRSIGNNLVHLGIDVADPSAETEVISFLESLKEDGFLTINNDQPTSIQQTNGSTTALTSVELDFNDWLVEQNLLPSAFFELTYRCNQQCIHCFNPKSDHSAALNELATEEIIRVLQDVASLGTYTVTFSGGEASLRADLMEILAEAKRLGLSFNLFTNGQMPDQEVEKIVALWPRTVGVSLYSAIPEVHDATTRQPGSFDRSLRTLRILTEAGIRVTVKCPIMRHTVHGYKRILDLCDELNALPQFDLHISGSLDGNMGCAEHQLLDEELLAFIMRDPLIAMYVGLDLPDAGRRRRPIDGSVCGAGRYSLSIAPDGTVYPCNSLPLPVGNVRNGGLKQIWQDSETLRAWNSVVLSHFNECGLYAKCSFCNHCPGMAMVACGDLFAINETCCTTARVRMEVSDRLRNGVDPLQSEKAKEFGWSKGLRLPVISNDPRNVIGDPRISPLDEFVRHVKQIHATGNQYRKNFLPEPQSAEAENIRIADGDGVSGFYEFGR